MSGLPFDRPPGERRRRLEHAHETATSGDPLDEWTRDLESRPTGATEEEGARGPQMIGPIIIERVKHAMCLLLLRYS